jgi:NurA-like 5'-3' nuclease
MTQKVKLTYFKPSGKWYENGEYESNIPFSKDFKIYDEVRVMNIIDKKLPGLYSGEWDGYILVVPESGVPYLIIPDEEI